MDQINGTSSDVTPAESTPVTPAESTPVTPATRRRRSATVATPAPRKIRNVADAVAVARHVTPANFDAMVSRHRPAGIAFGGPARNVGAVSGSRVMDLQNDFMADNRGLNDLQILFVWRVDFPGAVGRVFTADAATGVSIVRGVRAEYNRNGHGAKSDAWKTRKSESTGPRSFDFPKPKTATA